MSEEKAYSPWVHPVGRAATMARWTAAGLDLMDYDTKWGRYRFRLQRGDVKKHADVLRQLLEASYRESGGTEA